MKRPKLLLTFLVLTLINLTGANLIRAQQILTKEQLAEKANALFEGGRAREAIGLINQYPDFAEEPEILYIKSVSYVDLREFKNADAAFQKQFDIFLQNAAESRKLTLEISSGEPSANLKKDMISIMYGATLISFASADLTNSLRTVAFEKAVITAAKREPKNLIVFDEFRKNYEQTALEAANFFLQTVQLKEALSNFSKVIEINPKNAAAYQGRAKVYRKQRKLKLAQADELKAKKMIGK